MADLDQRELLKKMQTEGVPEESNERYPETLLEVDEADVDVTGPKAKYEHMRSWTPGQAMILITFKILDGEWKNGKFTVTTGLFTGTGKLRAYKGYRDEATGRYVPNAELYDIIQAIKKYDESQWDAKEPFSNKKLIGKKLLIGLRGGESNEKAYYFLATDRQLKKDEEYRNNQAANEEETEFDDEEIEEVFEKPSGEKKVAKKSSEKKMEIEDKDLPF